MDKIEQFRKFILEEYNIINPILTFDGDYVYGDNFNPEEKYNYKHDMLVINSKTNERGDNYYIDLASRKLLYDLQGLEYAEYTNKYFCPVLLNRMDEDGKGRHIEFSLFRTLWNIMEDKTRLLECEDESEMVQICLNYYKELRSKLKDVLKNDKESVYYNEIEERFHVLNHEVNSDNLRKYLDSIKDLVHMIRSFEVTTRKPVIITPDELLKCFDIDKFILIVAKSVLNNQGWMLSHHDKLDSSFVLVSQMVTTLEEMGINNFNPTIKIYDKKTRKIIDYTFKDMLKEFKTLYNKHYDKFKPAKFDIQQVEKMDMFHNNEAYETFIHVLGEQEEKIIKTEFDILAKGESESRTQGLSTREIGAPANKKSISEEEVLYRKYIFENTNYKCKIIGRDKFNGYIGFIYENGLVVFERFYEDDGKPSKDNATYIMNYKNFVEFIQLTKQEILEYIKSTDNPDIKRLYHSKNWADNLGNYLDSVEKNMETIVFAQTFNKDKFSRD